MSVPPPGYEDPLAARTPAPPPPPPAADGRPVWLWLAGATVLALAAFAFISLRGGEPGGGGPFSPVAEAAEKTANVPGARVAGTGSVSSGGVTMEMRLTGAYSGEDELSTMRMDIQTNVPYAGSQISPMTAVMDGVTMYMTAPIFTGALPDGKSWMKIDFSEIASIPEDQSAVDARAMLGQLQAAGEVTQLGTERVRGVRTTHYTATVTSAEAAAAARERGDELAAAILEQAPGTSTSDVWIDRRGYVRRIATRMPFAVPGQPAAEMAMTMEFFDFGIEPQIEVPSDDVSFDATELAVEGLEEQLDL